MGLPDELCLRLDEKRGPIPRVAYIRMLVESNLEGELVFKSSGVPREKVEELVPELNVGFNMGAMQDYIKKNPGAKFRFDAKSGMYFLKEV